jgi:hypothetical protein
MDPTVLHTLTTEPLESILHQPTIFFKIILHTCSHFFQISVFEAVLIIVVSPVFKGKLMNQPDMILHF